MPVLQTVNLSKVYRGDRGAPPVRALDGFHLTVRTGEFIAIMGPSGSGKSTLLNLLGTMDTPTLGEALIDGQNLAALSGNALADFRRRRLGFIYQQENLLDYLTLQENILLPLSLERTPRAEAECRLHELAERLSLTNVLGRYPYQVAGGEQQRAAAARALIHRPSLVLADEPTASLDSRSARRLMEALSQLNAAERATIIMATHDPVAASYCQRVLFIQDGRLYTEVRRGVERRVFYQQIADAISAMGGEQGDSLYVPG